jgi:hypothetical protein
MYVHKRVVKDGSATLVAAFRCRYGISCSGVLFEYYIQQRGGRYS